MHMYDKASDVGRCYFVWYRSAYYSEESVELFGRSHGKAFFVITVFTVALFRLKVEEEMLFKLLQHYGG